MLSHYPNLALLDWLFILLPKYQQKSGLATPDYHNNPWGNIWGTQEFEQKVSPEGWKFDVKSQPDSQKRVSFRRGLDHLICPNGGAFNHLFGQIPTLSHPLPQRGLQMIT